MLVWLQIMWLTIIGRTLSCGYESLNNQLQGLPLVGLVYISVLFVKCNVKTLLLPWRLKDESRFSIIPIWLSGKIRIAFDSVSKLIFWQFSLSLSFLLSYTIIFVSLFTSTTSPPPSSVYLSVAIFYFP